MAEQHYQSFKSELPELFADLQLFTGTVSAKKRQQIWQTAEIIFSTPQCIANDLKNSLYDLKEVSLLVLDEAHRCLKNYDYTNVAKFYKQQAQNPRSLGLTASPGYEQSKINQICKHLDVESIEIRTRESEDVKPYLQKLEFTKIEVPFPKEFLEIKEILKSLYDQKIEKLKAYNLIYPPINKITLLQLQNKLAAQFSSRNFTAMRGMSLTAQAIKISHAIELLETQTLSGLKDYLDNLKKQAEQKKSKAAQTIANSKEFQTSYEMLKTLIALKIEHPKLEELKTLVENEIKENPNSKIIIFSQFRETATKICKEINKITNIKAQVFLGQMKKQIRGLITGLSQKEQKGVIDKFRTGKINVICATAIGEEGLDIPEVNAVFFYETIPSAIRKIQRAGRTARLSPGKLFILITKDTRDITYHYVARARERKMYKTIDNIKENLKKENKTLEDFK